MATTNPYMLGASGILPGWKYWKMVTLSRASGAVTNYQMKLLVGESSGATGEDVDCNSHVQADFDDLRFTTINGTLLDYWIESISADVSPNKLATVWIEFNSIGIGATTFYMYYGNAAAAAVSSGANTFIVFDDFERGIDGDEVGGSWTELNGIVHISTEQKYGGSRSMKLKGSAAAPRCNISVTASDNIAIYYRFFVSPTTVPNHNLAHGDTNTWLTYVQFQSDLDILWYDGAAWQDTGDNFGTNAWHTFELRKFVWATPVVDFVYDGTVIQAAADISYGTTGAEFANKVRFDTDAGSDLYKLYIDNFIVRNYRPTEPAWGTWSAEATR